jgi:alpha-L-rhamnosidase
LTHASARHRSPYGEVAIGWRIEGDELVVKTTVPVGTTATLELPGRDAVPQGPGTHEVRVPTVATALA